MKKSMPLFILAFFVIIFLKNDVKADEQLLSKYTNEPVSKEQATKRPISVMIPTDKDAQPAYGIGSADILYEIMEEGNISRQLAIIPDWEKLEQIGNIRSSRLYYIEIAKEWDPIFVHFGGVFYMKDAVTDENFNNLSGTYEYGAGGEMPGAGYFYRSPYKKAPHNAYINGNGIISACKELGYSMNIRDEFYNETNFKFAYTTNDLASYSSEATNATVVDLSQIFPYSKSSFIYDEDEKVYYKKIHNMPQTDGLTKKQLSFTNIIIQYTKWNYQADNKYLDFQTIDSTETGLYITNGKCIPVTWKKTSDYSPTLYYDTKGNEIQLNSGKTYIAIAQKGRAAIVK